MQIRGNVEYDRYTLRVYDYLNFLSFYFGYPISRHIDMPGVELLDEAGDTAAHRPVPLRAAFPMPAASAARAAVELVSRCVEARRRRQLAQGFSG